MGKWKASLVPQDEEYQGSFGSEGFEEGLGIVKVCTRYQSDNF